MIFSYDIPTYAIVLFAIAFVGLLYILIFYLGRLRLVVRQRKCCDAAALDDKTLPRASVVVFTRNDEALLAKALQPILNQDFPGEFEVIVVNDGQPNETDSVITRLKPDHPNLYLTYVPDETRNISRRKMAIQLGVKAAKGEVVIITDASTAVPSDQWLKQMVAPFTDDAVEVVLGYNALNVPKREYAGRLVTVFDCTADAVAWLSSAVRHRPYRGCANNIAYRRDTYFKNNGFHSSFNLHFGDDDLFVNEITTPTNTVVQISSETIGTSGSDAGIRRRYRRFRIRHAFTGRTLPKTSRRIMAFGEWLLWIIPACAVLGALLCGVTNIFGWAIAFIIVVTMYVAIIDGWRGALRALNAPAMALTIPFAAAFRPLRNMKISFASRPSKNAWYTWE